MPSSSRLLPPSRRASPPSLRRPRARPSPVRIWRERLHSPPLPSSSAWIWRQSGAHELRPELWQRRPYLAHCGAPSLPAAAASLQPPPLRAPLHRTHRSAAAASSPRLVRWPPAPAGPSGAELVRGRDGVHGRLGAARRLSNGGEQLRAGKAMHLLPCSILQRGQLVRRRAHLAWGRLEGWRRATFSCGDTCCVEAHRVLSALPPHGIYELEYYVQCK